MHLANSSRPDRLNNAVTPMMKSLRQKYQSKKKKNEHFHAHACVCPGGERESVSNRHFLVAVHWVNLSRPSRLCYAVTSIIILSRQKYQLNNKMVLFVPMRACVRSGGGVRERVR